MIQESLDDTIIAQSTPPGIGGIGILRISGEKSDQICEKILKKRLKPRYATYLPFYGSCDQILDYGIAIYFAKPNSFTGENIVELHAHGGQFVLDILLENILRTCEIRMAYPGEFTKRAFLNNKVDLVQAESICELINASNKESIRRSIEHIGKDSKSSMELRSIKRMVEEVESMIEIEINFPEENISSPVHLIYKRIQNIISKLESIFNKAHKNVCISDSIKVAIIGKPNSGKSSLMNLLSGKETSIVTSIRGTTRDVIKENMYINGILIQISDTAGIRKSNDDIERIGIKRALNEVKKSDHILYVTDNICEGFFSKKNYILSFLKKNLKSHQSYTIIRNKIDVDRLLSKVTIIEGCNVIFLSVRTEDGLNILKKHLKRTIQRKNHVESALNVKYRYYCFAKKALKHLKRANNLSCYQSVEMVAEEVKSANRYLNQIFNGKKYSSQKILNDIFSNFCIGK
ncbi:tRNA uridine-5-carboxymethylaminomethyl(34) synthesis GTPase MnmE [Candidatus Riesia pediculischaeffi]|uniref:tRNA modification GTPase MnmE n=1 Tax=Candidatus Riesia pediculischaeffi PTSU TaxID=1401651 RepID=A0A0C1VJA4_9ENTR|nr:tRNA uridine-5-carboxymethylaminomethyl(34) synthesis GTPase MnmE [Candidatus Riesia pediculischaeffi]KIE63920.1 GTPase and tRNA-U34 5-formylation enzyme TrmE [Candidatus Riesia pediculischaeffi PTSU]